MQQAKAVPAVPDAKRGRRRAVTAPASTRPGRLPSRPFLAPGRILFDRYRLERELGRGGVAEVWRAHDERLDRSVAVKVLHPELLPDERWRERFIREAQAASGLAHPGIVPVYDVVDDPQTPAIVFQLVDGESLAARLARDGSIPVPEATRIAGQVAAALDHAHRAGVIHRDVKPANIVLDDDGRARLVDFGIARLVDDASAEPARREVVGTLRYMAPEQLAGQPGDARTDLYALGLVIAEMVPDLSVAPGWLAELVTRLGAADPADRPASAADVARVLESGRLQDASTGEPAGSGSPGPAVAVAGAPPEVDPDAVTRTFDDPDAAPRPIADSNDGTGKAAFVGPLATALPALAASGDVTPAAGAMAPSARPSARRAADRRPVIAAVLVAGLILGAVTLGRAALFGVAVGRPTTDPSIGAPASPVPTLQSTPVPVQAPAPAGPKPHKLHGHGHGPGG